ncbi:MAG: D-alanine--D-alanine ligase [Oscillospiraceae bacterium]|jgi:D-alanine-D-alanine ligase|nr:D-alanine--D-alanine ligase [Oscillospiraceae bacterium]
MKKNIVLLFGGASSEYEVSGDSAVNILRSLSTEKYNVITVGITRLGKWLKYSGPSRGIADGTWEDHPLNKEVIFSPNASKKGFFIFDDKQVEFCNVSVVFPVLHGKNGEDGRTQAGLELSRMPFVGCSSASGSNCMDKIISNVLLTNSGIEKPKYFWFYFLDYKKNPQKIINKIKYSLGNYPFFVKPARSGSSVGVSKADNETELKTSIDLAAKEDYKILVEEAIKGRELECAILGRGLKEEEMFVSLVGELTFEDEFYSYEVKYGANTLNARIPAEVDHEISQKIREIAKKAYKVMECSGLSRVDFFLRDSDSKILLNEINTMPGFTGFSMFPLLMEKSGISTPELLDRLIDLAIERDDNF